MDRRRKYALLLWLLSGLFALRVLGQAIQLWAPVRWLPSFESFQGSGLPYWALLPAQALILIFAVCHSWDVQQGKVEPRPVRGRALVAVGGVYLTASFRRLVIGLVPGAPQWFRAWIPGAFHLVLAAYVVTLGAYHLGFSVPASVSSGRAATRCGDATRPTVAPREGEIGEMADWRAGCHG